MHGLPHQRVTIGAFRGLRSVELSGCGRVNILVGGNNSGKTSILEALLILANPFSLEQWRGVIELRTAWPLVDRRFGRVGTNRLDSISWLFPHIDGEPAAIELAVGDPPNGLIATVERIIGEPPDRPIVESDEVMEASFARRNTHEDEGSEEPLEQSGLIIEVSLGKMTTQSHSFDAIDDSFRMVLWEKGALARGQAKSAWPSIPVAFATPISHRSDGYLAAHVSKILRKDRKPRALEILRRLDSRVMDLIIVTPEDSESRSVIPRRGSAPTLHVEFEGTGLVPVHALGDGVRRALHFAILLADLDQGGLLLIDEIESAMHISVLSHVFGWLSKECLERGVQLFATTHSLEAVDSMLSATPDEELTVYRLRDGKTRRFSGEILRVSRTELGQELR
ncbi:MAG: AAA family ATPase [Myxococcota bacterium]